MKLFDTAAVLSTDEGEVQLEQLSSKMAADPLLVGKSPTYKKRPPKKGILTV
jgi:hypothetical protein